MVITNLPAVECPESSDVSPLLDELFKDNEIGEKSFGPHAKWYPRTKQLVGRESQNAVIMKCDNDEDPGIAKGIQCDSQLTITAAKSWITLNVSEDCSKDPGHFWVTDEVKLSLQERCNRAWVFLYSIYGQDN